MKNFSPIKDRIREFCDTQGVSIKEIYTKTGISDGTLSNKSGMNEQNLMKFFSSYPEVSVEWLVLGQGEMIKGGGSSSSDDVVHLKKVVEGEGVSIPLYNSLASAGGGELALSSEFIIDEIKVPFGRQQDVAITIFGDSMSPYLYGGDLAVVREMHSWREYVEFGKVFIVVTMDEVFCKVIKKHEDANRFVLHSLNQAYDDFEIPVSLVRKIYKVMGVVSQRSN